MHLGIINIFYIVVAVIIFIFIYAIGEIIQIIHDIRRRLYKTMEVKEEKNDVIEDE